MSAHLRNSLALVAAVAVLLAVVPASVDAAHDGDLVQACPAERTPEDGFRDVPEANVHEDAVDCVAWWGVAAGRSRHVYEPAASVRRAQMASFVARAMQATGYEFPSDPDDRFSDDERSVHEARINALASAGVVRGTGGGRFEPGASVTRAQMASFVVRAIEVVIDGELPRGGDHFPDDDGSTHEAAIDKAAQAGIARGDDGRYHPDEAVRRDATGSLLARTLDSLVERRHGQPPPPRAVPGPDPFEDEQWGLQAVKARGAWQVASGRGTVVAIVDTGVDREHLELAGELVEGASWIDCAEAPPCDAWDDGNGHGTHVAGIAAAPLDGRGIVGVAPDAAVMPVRVLDDDGNGNVGDVAAGIRWAVEHGADVVNLSLAGLPVVSQFTSTTGFDGGYADAIAEAVDAGVLVVAAAGNEGSPLCASESFRERQALCVGATDRRDVKAPYSNDGYGLDLVAPGGLSTVLCESSEDVLSTYAVDQDTTCPERRGYEFLGGTSMAAPHASGAGALLAELGIRGRHAAERLAETADDLGTPGYDPVHGHGRLHAHRAVAR